MDDIASEILEKVKGFQEAHRTHFSNFNDWYKLYRCQPGPRAVGKSNTFIPEIFTEIEALATAVFEMIFSDASEASFFDVYPQGWDDELKAFYTKAILADQMETVELQRKIMPFLRGVIRDGYAPIEIPWVLEYGWRNINGVMVRTPRYDCFDFQYIQPSQFSCSEGAESLAGMEWTCRTSSIPFARAKRMERVGLWKDVDKAAVNASQYSEEEKARRAIAGLPPESKTKMLKYHEYFGYLEGTEDDFMYRVVVSNSGVILRGPEINPYADGEAPYLDCKWIETDGELYGIGVVEINAKQQNEINSRRNFINDNLFAALYNMWKMSTDCGYKSDGGRLVWEAYKVLNMDNVNGLEPLRPPLEGVVYARQLEETDREAMRRQSGASSTLQGISQGMTATESQIVQNEATRRLRALVRSQLGVFLKKVLYKFHARNLQFLDRAKVIRAEGPDGRIYFDTVNGNSLSVNPDISMKLTTDLDFRIFHKKELLEFLQGFAMLAKSQGFNIDPLPIIRQIGSAFNMNPNMFKRELDINRAMTQPDVQQVALKGLVAGSPAAQAVLAGRAPVAGGMGIARNLAAGAGMGTP